MARQEQDREDILRQASALVERIEIELPNRDEILVVGFRRDGSASFFFGADFVLQFTSLGELRRAYWDGRLVKAERGRLFFMDKQRGEAEVVLRTVPFAAHETARFLSLAQQRLAETSSAIQSANFRALRQIPLDIPIISRVRTWLETFGVKLTIAQRPNVR